MNKRIIAAALIAAAFTGCGQINESTANIINTTENTSSSTEPVISDTAPVAAVTVTSTASTPAVTATAADDDSNPETTAAKTEPLTAETVIAIQPETSPVQTTAPAVGEYLYQETTAPAQETDPPAPVNYVQTSDVFALLDSLDYHAISCDGLPEYKLTAPDGTAYLINFDGGWVWRRPSLIADADNEAPLAQSVIDAIYANWDSLNISQEYC